MTAIAGADPLDVALARLGELTDIGLGRSRHSLRMWLRVFDLANDRGDAALAHMAALACALHPQVAVDALAAEAFQAVLTQLDNMARSPARAPDG